MGEQVAGVVPKALLDGVVEQFRPVRVILFGSRARGDARPDSDYDLLVVVDDDLPDDRQGWRAVNDARRVYSGPVDILSWSNSAYEAERGVTGSLPWTADREGVVVYGHKVQLLTGDPAGVRPELAARWLAKADEDLRTAKLCAQADPPIVSMAGYHCQQCAEKLIKACLLLAEVPFGKTHNFGALIGQVPEGFPAEIVAAMERVRGLTDWAFSGRYPSKLSKKEPEQPTLPAVERAIHNLDTLRSMVAAAIERV